MVDKKTIFRKILRAVIIPLSFLVIYLTLVALWGIFDLPPQDKLIEIIKEFFNRYGLAVVFTGAIIEGFLLLGQYFPGGFIIFLAVISAGQNIPRVAGVVLTVSLAFFISYYLNYLVGKYGWYRIFLKFGLKDSIENSKRKLEKHILKAVLGSYWEPNLASFTATAAGILRIPAATFLNNSAIGIVIWNIFWGIFVFLLGDTALKLAGRKYLISIFSIWILIVIVVNFIQAKKPRSDNLD